MPDMPGNLCYNLKSGDPDAPEFLYMLAWGFGCAVNLIFYMGFPLWLPNILHILIEKYPSEIDRIFQFSKLSSQIICFQKLELEPGNNSELSHFLSVSSVLICFMTTLPSLSVFKLQISGNQDKGLERDRINKGFVKGIHKDNEHHQVWSPEQINELLLLRTNQGRSGSYQGGSYWEFVIRVWTTTIRGISLTLGNSQHYSKYTRTMRNSLEDSVAIPTMRGCAWKISLDFCLIGNLTSYYAILMC